MDNQFSGKETTIFKDNYEELKVLRFAIENAPIAVSMADSENRLFFHNKFFKKMFDYNIEEFKNKSLETLYVDPDVSKKVIKTVTGGDSWAGEVEMMDKSGRILPVMLRFEATRDENDNIISFIGIYSDITKRKKIEKELKYQHEYLSTLHSISLGMFRRLNLSDLLNAIMVRASKITRIPNGFLHLYDPDQHILEIRAACGNLSDYMGFKMEPGKGFAGKVFETGEPLIINKYQSWPQKIKGPLFDRIYSIVGIPLVSGSKIVGVIGLSHDKEEFTIEPEIISILEEFSGIAQIAIDNAKLFESQSRELEKRKALEKERKEMMVRLHQSQRMESIGTLAGGIAHDFNNILSSIMGFTQIAQGDVEKGSVLEDDLGEIYKASLRAKDLVQQILTFARQSDDQVNAIKVSIIAKEVLKFIRASVPSTINITQNINSTSKIMANPTQVYQIFLNLFTNASQAMGKEGGTLRVDMTDEVLEKTYKSITPGSYIRINISDTGAGIAKEHIHTIFEPYFTTKQIGEGTGLGLAVVHGTVKSLGGEIFVESVLGQGTMFTLYFPIVQKPESEFEYEYKDEESPLGRQEHILFVDDEISITKVAARLLEGLNYKVTILNSSREALKFFRSDPDVFGAVLTDMTMPGMTGDKLAVELKKIRSDIPIILCTGFDKHIGDKELKKKGINYFCKKPFSRAQLAVAVRNAIDENTKHQE
ncbi:MAG: GAF domain-containing protein [Desulfobacula sp.]|nr:GAF domain-containing protein [Desulfobacula sp.]